jgi:hypothetical protein
MGNNPKSESSNYIQETRYLCLHSPDQVGARIRRSTAAYTEGGDRVW